MSGAGRKRQRTPSTGRAQSPKKNVNFRRGSRIEQGPSGTGDIDTRTRSPKKAAIQSRTPQEPPESGIDSWEVSRMSDDELALRGHELLITIETDPTRPDTGEFSADYIVKTYYDLHAGKSLRDAVFYLMQEQDHWVRHSPYSVVNVPSLGSRTPAVGGSASGPTARPQQSESPLGPHDFASKSPSKDNDKDLTVCDGIAKLVDRIRDFSLYFVGNPDANKLAPNFFRKLLVRENEQLIRYLGCLAIAGKGGERSWEKLLTDPSTRSALVVGILGRALKEHVFGDLWFGGSPEEKAALAALEQKNVDTTDGFSRTEARAKLVQKYAKTKDSSTLDLACTKIALQLGTLLTPFWDGVARQLPRNLADQLHYIVRHAAKLSRAMREAPNVVYYWPPTFKDEEFEPSRMECLNLKDMILASPYEKKKVGNFERAVIKEGNEQRREAIVRVVCFPGLVAYRQGGGQLAQDELAEEKRKHSYEPKDVASHRQQLAQRGIDSFTGHEGFRSKVICKSVVYLAWDRQRLLTKEAGTSAHIDAMKPGGNREKYVDDYNGFVELYDVARNRWNRA